MPRISKKEKARRAKISSSLKATHRKESLRRQKISEALKAYHKKHKVEKRYIPPGPPVSPPKIPVWSLPPEPPKPPRRGGGDVIPPPKDWIEPILPPGYGAGEGREDFVYNLKDKNPFLPSEYPLNINIGALLIVRGKVDSEILSTHVVMFNTGSGDEEFWSNYFAAVREYIDKTWGDGTKGSGKGKSPTAIFNVLLPTPRGAGEPPRKPPEEKERIRRQKISVGLKRYYAGKKHLIEMRKRAVIAQKAKATRVARGRKR
jgi:hypothetical protein